MTPLGRERVRQADSLFYIIGKGEENMSTYATQMEAARKGIVTEELKKVAKKECESVSELINEIM